MRSPYNIGPVTPEKLGLLSAAIPSPAGDVVGLLADAWGYAKEPESLTPARGLLSLAGLLPGIPRSGSMNDAAKIAKDYRLMHKPMQESGGAARLHDLLPSFGEDIYGANAQRYFGSGSYDAAEKKVLDMFRKLRGKPDEMVDVFRGVPDGVEKINEGDWVTLLPEIAQEYGPNVLRMRVPASHITSWPDSLLEFGYWPIKP